MSISTILRGPLLLAALLVAMPAPQAAGLQVEPVLIDVAFPGAASALTLGLEGSRSANVQIRVLRWAQQDGVEKLLPTDDVVISPPAARLKPGADYTVRVVRVSRAAVRGEESYRVIVDQ